jgi:phage-related protein
MAQAVVEGITTERMELSKALEHVEAILAEVLSSIQKLNDESQQAKQEITEAFGRQMTHLHSRETQLLRQVFAVILKIISLLSF